MQVNLENVALIVNQIQSGKSCRISVFSKKGFEVGYSVKPRFQAFNLKTRKYDGEWVEPKDEIIQFLDGRHKVCASLYDKQEFERLISESDLKDSVDYCDCLEQYLAQIDTDLKCCLEEFKKPVLSWTEFVKVASLRRRLMISASYHPDFV